MDQRGPGISSVKECTSLGIDDLGNVFDFEQPGKGVYGFLSIKDGYTRIPVQAAEPFWFVDLDIKQSQTHMRKAALTHLANAGKMRVSYAPASTQKGLAVVEGFCPHYLLRTKTGSATNVVVKAITTFTKDNEMLEKPPAGSTIIIKIILFEPVTAWKEVLPNLSIQSDQPSICALFIKNNKVKSTSPALKTQIAAKDKKELIIGTHCFQIEPLIGFIGLQFTTEEVPDSYIDIVTADIERLNALLTSKA